MIGAAACGFCTRRRPRPPRWPSLAEREQVGRGNQGETRHRTNLPFLRRRTSPSRLTGTGPDPRLSRCERVSWTCRTIATLSASWAAATSRGLAEAAVVSSGGRGAYPVSRRRQQIDGPSGSGHRYRCATWIVADNVSSFPVIVMGGTLRRRASEEAAEQRARRISLRSRVTSPPGTETAT